MIKNICIHIVGWVFAILYAYLIKYNDPSCSSGTSFLIYLGSIYLLEAIVLYIGYGFAYQFIYSKRRYIYFASFFILYILFFHILPILTRGNVFSDTTDLILSVVSHSIRIGFWLAGGIVLRIFFDIIINKKSACSRLID